MHGEGVIRGGCGNSCPGSTPHTCLLLPGVGGDSQGADGVGGHGKKAKASSESPGDRSPTPWLWLQVNAWMNPACTACWGRRCTWFPSYRWESRPRGIPKQEPGSHLTNLTPKAFFFF